MKLEAVVVTVVRVEEDEYLSALARKVHITALQVKSSPPHSSLRGIWSWETQTITRCFTFWTIWSSASSSKLCTTAAGKLPMTTCSASQVTAAIMVTGYWLLVSAVTWNQFIAAARLKTAKAAKCSQTVWNDARITPVLHYYSSHYGPAFLQRLTTLVRFTHSHTHSDTHIRTLMVEAVMQGANSSTWAIWGFSILVKDTSTWVLGELGFALQLQSIGF